MATDMETCTIRYHSRSESVQLETPTIMAPPRDAKWRPQSWLRYLSKMMNAAVSVTSTVGSRLLSAPFAYLFPPSEEADSPDDEDEEKAVNTSQQFFPDDDEDESQLQRGFELTDRILGRGMSGTVYAALDRSSSEEVAVKVIKLTGKEALQEVTEEIQLLDMFQHPSVVRFLDYQLSEDQQTCNIYMEQMTSLSSLLRSQLGSEVKGNEERISVLARKLLEGIEFIHSHGFVHRDIKGDNTLVNLSTGDCKIADFGSCAAAPCQEANVGTVPYMAPEVIDPSKGDYGTLADIWSFACTLLEMVTGRQPFLHLKTEQIIWQVGMGQGKCHPLIPDNLSVEAKEVLKACFVHQSQRPEAAELLNYAFFQPA